MATGTVRNMAIMSKPRFTHLTETNLVFRQRHLIITKHDLYTFYCDVIIPNLYLCTNVVFSFYCCINCSLSDQIWSRRKLHTFVPMTHLYPNVIFLPNMVSSEVTHFLHVNLLIIKLASDVNGPKLHLIHVFSSQEER